MLQLLLDRAWKKADYTIGRLYLNGEFFCNTLEDKVRDLNKTAKVKGMTAIPAGEYEVSMNIISPKSEYTSFPLALSTIESDTFLSESP